MLLTNNLIKNTFNIQWHYIKAILDIFNQKFSNTFLLYDNKEYNQYNYCIDDYDISIIYVKKITTEEINKIDEFLKIVTNV